MQIDIHVSASLLALYLQLVISSLGDSSSCTTTDLAEHACRDNGRDADTATMLQVKLEQDIHHIDDASSGLLDMVDTQIALSVPLMPSETIRLMQLNNKVYQGPTAAEDLHTHDGKEVHAPQEATPTDHHHHNIPTDHHGRVNAPSRTDGPLLAQGAESAVPTSAPKAPVVGSVSAGPTAPAPPPAAPALSSLVKANMTNVTNITASTVINASSSVAPAAEHVPAPAPPPPYSHIAAKPVILKPINTSAPQMAALNHSRALALLDCIADPWTAWGPCRFDDGDMYHAPHQTRQRVIVQQPKTGGKPCPSPLVESRLCRDGSAPLTLG